MAAKPMLDDHAIDRSASIVSSNNSRDAEAVRRQQLQKIQLPDK